jgi:glycosyltransferase involved in cell wall biosynthesis
MRIAFVSSMYGSTWGGSEELWGGAALILRQQGHDVFCGLIDWPGPAPKRDALRKSGCQLSIRIDVPDFKNRLLNRIKSSKNRILQQNPVPTDLLAFHPDLVVISQMFTDDGLDWMEFCETHQLPFVTIVQAATEYQWPDDQLVSRLRNGYLKARLACFVSQHNLRLCESQIATKIPHAEVVWNPYDTNLTELIPWPEPINGIYKIACVGRLQPDAKGQDILVEVLANPKWKARPIELTFFGNGCNRQWLEDYCKMHNVNAIFGGFTSIKEIWKSHHLLVHPTRKEGMPIVVIEAALCGRPVVATATAGIPEFVEEGVNGFLAPFAEASLFDATLEKAWNHRDSWRDLGIAAHEKILSRLTGKPEEEFAEKLLVVAGASRSSPC